MWSETIREDRDPRGGGQDLRSPFKPPSGPGEKDFTRSKDQDPLLGDSLKGEPTCCHFSSPFGRSRFGRFGRTLEEKTVFGG